jgi:hypothetical protein
MRVARKEGLFHSVRTPRRRGEIVTASRRNPWRDAGWLLVLCLVGYTAGLTTHGLTNWQEARRAVVAREMYSRGEWIVPTYFGEPYIAKPPMIYWMQMLIARGREVAGGRAFEDETEIRLTVALAGLAGVLATYFAARSMLRDRFDARLGDDAAWLSALGLASGVLFFRSSRIGELDVLLVPCVVTAVAAILAVARVERGVPWRPIAIATLASTAAAMTKGPPALLVIALAGYGSLLLAARPEGDGGAHPPHASRGTILGLGTPIAAALVILGLALRREVSPLMGAVGVACFGGMGFLLAAGVTRLREQGRLRACIGALAYSHPILILGVPIVVVWVWGLLVARRVGSDHLASLAGAELDDNLRLLVLDSPAKNIGFMLYGLAPMSIAMLGGVVWLVRERPRLSTEQRTPFIWCGLGLAAFSLIGKGVARYLTPMWPGVAMIGGLWLATTLRDAERAKGHPRWRFAVVFAFVAAMAGQAWWYGWGRQIHYADRSPREFIRELLPSVDPARLGVWRFDEPAIDFYAGERVERHDDSGALAAVIAAKPYTIIAREGDEEQWGSALADNGITAERVDVRAPYAWRADGRRIRAWRLTPR